MRTMTWRRSTAALTFGAAVALALFAAMPVHAQGEGGDTRQDAIDARQFNNARAFTATTTYTAVPAYVAVPTPAQTATTYTTTSPDGTTTTTTYASLGVTYVPAPAPAYSAMTVIAPRPCNAWDVPRPGVMTACPY